MGKIANYDQIIESMSAIKALGHGFITNFYHDASIVELWQKYDYIRSITIGDTLLIIRMNDGFWNLFYCSSTLSYG